MFILVANTYFWQALKLESACTQYVLHFYIQRLGYKCFKYFCHVLNIFKFYSQCFCTRDYSRSSEAGNLSLVHSDTGVYSTVTENGDSRRSYSRRIVASLDEALRRIKLQRYFTEKNQRLP